MAVDYISSGITAVESITSAFANAKGAKNQRRVAELNLQIAREDRAAAEAKAAAAVQVSARQVTTRAPDQTMLVYAGLGLAGLALLLRARSNGR